MGIRASFPVSKKPPCYNDPSKFSSTGEHQDPAEVDCEINEVHKPVAEFMTEYVNLREEINQAKLKFHEIDVDRLNRRYPKWNLEDILDFKAQFQSFDLNGDGLIDFSELCMGLDELGDTSTHDDRRMHFTTLDADGSGAVDFEEYLELVYVLLKNKTKDLMYNSDVTPRNIRKLSVVKRIEHGLF